MWDKKRIITVCLLLIFFFTPLSGSVTAQSSGTLYFEETGYSISGQFLEFYESTPNALILFGYPISEEFKDPTTGIETQYFQHIRLDIDLSTDKQEVKIAPLGTLMYENSGNPVPLMTSPASCQTITPSGYQICYDFLRFYQQYDGDQYFGAPISNMQEQDGRIVQYFENIRLEWRPELPSGQKVGLSDLGRMYYDQHVGSLYQNTSFDGYIIASELPHIKVHAFVSNALTAPNSKQKVFIIVQDQNLLPVEGAMVQVTVHQYGQLGDAYRAPMTDSNGISILEFEIGDIPVKQIMNVEVNVNYEGQEVNTTSWFRIWW